MATTPAKVARGADHGRWSEGGGLSPQEWRTIKRRGVELLRRAKDLEACLRRLRERAAEFLGGGSKSFKDAEKKIKESPSVEELLIPLAPNALPPNLEINGVKRKGILTGESIRKFNGRFLTGDYACITSDLGIIRVDYEAEFGGGGSI